MNFVDTCEVPRTLYWEIGVRIAAGTILGALWP